MKLPNWNSRISFSNMTRLFSPVIPEDANQRNSVVKVPELDSRRCEPKKFGGKGAR